jgi:hypothetical protein
VSVYDNGLVYRRGGREQVTAWDEIESYTHESACRIITKSGVVIEFGLSIEGVDEVAQVIEAQTLQRRLPQAKAAIEKGESVQFKGLKPFSLRRPGRALNTYAFASSGFSADAHGLTELDTGERMAWADVQAFGVAEESMGRATVEVFMITGSHARFQTRLGLLSNAHVLLALCAEFTGLEAIEGN